jgi:hypothetical protein
MTTKKICAKGPKLCPAKCIWLLINSDTCLHFRTNMQFKLLKYDISLTTKGHKSLLYLSLTIKNYRQELLS